MADEEKENIRNIIEQLKTKSIGHGNYKKFVEAIRQRDLMLQTSMSNTLNSLDNYRSELDSALEHPQVKTMMEEEKIVPISIFDSYSKMYKAADEILIFRTLQAQMYKILCKKLANALGEIKSLDIEREALSRFSDMHDQHHKFTADLLNNKLKVVEEQLDAFKTLIFGEQQKFEEHMFLKMVQDMSLFHKENIGFMKEMLMAVDLPREKEKEIYNKFDKIPKQVYENDRDPVSIINSLKEQAKSPVKETKVEESENDDTSLADIPSAGDLGVDDSDDEKVEDDVLSDDSNSDDDPDDDDGMFGEKDVPKEKKEEEFKCDHPGCARTFPTMKKKQIHVEFYHT